MAIRPLPPLILALALLTGGSARADLVVVMNAASGVERLTRDETINIYMGRYRQLPSGLTALPIDLPKSAPERTHFYQLLVNKPPSEIEAYWARLIFSGKTSPPFQARTSAEAVSRLLQQKSAIAYLDRSQVDSRLRVVLELER